MFKKIPNSLMTAGVILLAFVAYFAFSMLLRNDSSNPVARVEESLFRVVTTNIAPAAYGAQIALRGRTEASRKISVRAQTAGVVQAVPTTEGSFVKKGTVLCAIAPDARRSALAQAEASTAKAQLDYTAAVALAQKGFQSNAGLAAAKAALGFNEAQLDQIKKDIAKTKIRAPFAGILTTQNAELGDYLSVGAPCATVAQIDPIRIVGALSEQQIGAVHNGDKAQVSLSTGERFTAIVRVTGAAASPATRTFQVELEAPNPDNILDGITADTIISTGKAQAALVPRNALLIGDQGLPGLRVIKNYDPTSREGDVTFIPITIISDDAEGIRITGISGPIRLITRGQNYVKQGQRVVSAKPGETLASGNNSTSPALGN